MNSPTNVTDLPQRENRSGVSAITPGCVRLRRWWWADDEAAAWNGQQVRHCDEVLRDLALTTPFTLDEFRAELARVRGRPLIVAAVGTRFPEIRSMWCRGTTTDYILVGSARPQLHRDHLALHGMGHMVFDHFGSPAVVHPIQDALTEADVARLRRSLKRVVYTYDEERQAEVFATRVQQLTGGWGVQGHLPAPPPLLARLSSVLEYQPQRRAKG